LNKLVPKRICGVFTISTSEKEEGDALLPAYDTMCSLFKDAVSDENWQGDNNETENTLKKVGHDLLKVAILSLDNASYKHRSKVY